jgi:hypothetical protein
MQTGHHTGGWARGKEEESAEFYGCRILPTIVISGDRGVTSSEALVAIGTCQVESFAVTSEEMDNITEGEVTFRQLLCDFYCGGFRFNAVWSAQ